MATTAKDQFLSSTEIGAHFKKSAEFIRSLVREGLVTPVVNGKSQKVFHKSQLPEIERIIKERLEATAKKRGEIQRRVQKERADIIRDVTQLKIPAGDKDVFGLRALHTKLDTLLVGLHHINERLDTLTVHQLEAALALERAPSTN